MILTQEQVYAYEYTETLKVSDLQDHDLVFGLRMLSSSVPHPEWSDHRNKRTQKPALIGGLSLSIEALFVAEILPGNRYLIRWTTYPEAYLGCDSVDCTGNNRLVHYVAKYGQVLQSQPSAQAIFPMLTQSGLRLTDKL